MLVRYSVTGKCTILIQGAFTHSPSGKRLSTPTQTTLRLMSWSTTLTTVWSVESTVGAAPPDPVARTGSGGGQSWWCAHTHCRCLRVWWQGMIADIHRVVRTKASIKG